MPLGTKWPTDHVRVLGVYQSYNKEQKTKANFQQIEPNFKSLEIEEPFTGRQFTYYKRIRCFTIFVYSIIY